MELVINAQNAPRIWLMYIGNMPLLMNKMKHELPIADSESKVHGANMGPTWALSAPDGPHVGPMNLAIWGPLPNHGNFETPHATFAAYYVRRCNNKEVVDFMILITNEKVPFNENDTRSQDISNHDIDLVKPG